MTEDIANAIMDWIDSDEERRVGGAESADYQGLAIPYSARNAPMESIEELLQIQGITPALFYGEDAKYPGWVEVQWSRPTGAVLDEVVTKLKALKLTIRNTPMDAAPADGPCVFTGAPAVERVLIARSY